MKGISFQPECWTLNDLTTSSLLVCGVSNPGIYKIILQATLMGLMLLLLPSTSFPCGYLALLQ
jgi:hypothetical protein